MSAHSTLSHRFFLALSALAAAPAMAQDAWTPSVDEQVVYDALLRREPAPTCDAVEALAADPVTTLLSLVEHAERPPWVGMRAADCLIANHAAEIKATLQEWVSDPESLGLALVALNSLDKMELEVGMSVARTALAGPLREEAAERILRADTPEIRALAEELPASE